MHVQNTVNQTVLFYINLYLYYGFMYVVLNNMVIGIMITMLGLFIVVT